MPPSPQPAALSVRSALLLELLLAWLFVFLEHLFCAGTSALRGGVAAQPASRAPLTETATRLSEAVEAKLRLEPPLPDSTLQACLWLPLPPPPRRP